MTIHPLPLGYLQTNCYILQGDTGRCLVIDPADSADVIFDFIQAKGLTLDAILLTHGHFDHVGAVKDLAAETDCPVYIHEADLQLPPAITAGKLYHTHTYAEGDEIALAGLTFKVLHTPGHTPGSVCLCIEADMFCGDTLFQGSCGRTDLPGGSPQTMRQTLHRLSQLEGSYTLWPGHGQSTTLAQEKRYNPYLR
ncbi:MAG: MBL fold metallo-hydrolase [Oscillospiraceae bacterium]|nr:MBL fold metallo-hydrolase [Oscillospiraceae bacterium]